MNLILLDYDVQNWSDKLKDFLSLKEDCYVYSLKDSLPLDFPNNDSVKGVILTALHGGWMRYHSEIMDKYPFVNHWVFCVVGISGEELKRTTINQFAAIASTGDIYCELAFDDGDFLTLSEKLAGAIKIQKKCLVVSLNADLAAGVKDILQGYLPDWEIEAYVGRNPDYALCDGVFVVGNTMEEMEINKPEIQSIKTGFWKNEPYFIDKQDKNILINTIGGRLNEMGWNIADYSSLTFFSSIHHELSYQRICKEEMTAAALLSDTEFVMWDDYGLPVVQSDMDDQKIISFLASHTIFEKMADIFDKNRRKQK